MAGDPITSDEAKKVIVSEELEFTAIHETIPQEPEPEPKPEPEPEPEPEPSEPSTPDTGMSTGEINALQISTSMIFIGVFALIVIRYAISRLNHKK